MACAEPQKPTFNPDEHCWQSTLDSPLDRLSAMYNLAKLTDLTIKFPDHQQSFKVHRLILAMSSPVFEAMLFGPMAEEGELQLPEDPPEAFQWLMGYIYCGSINLPDVPTAVKVYHLSNKYQMKALELVCSQYLQTQLKASNLPLIYDTASLFEDSALKQKCRQVVSTSANKVFSSSFIGELTRQSMKDLLQQEMEVTSEVTVYQGLLRWGASQADDESSESKDLNLRQTVEELLPHVRFLTMTMDEFVEQVMPSDVLTSDEKCAILMSLRKVGDDPLPQICSKIRRKRLVFDKKKCRTLKISQGDFIHDGQRLCLNPDYCLGYTGRGSTVRSSAQVHPPLSRQENPLHQENPDGSRAREENPDTLVVIRGMQVTMDIHLSRISWYTNSLMDETTLVITDSGGRVLREARPMKAEKEANRNGWGYSGEPYVVSFQEPLMVSCKETYDVSLRGEMTEDDTGAFSIQYGGLAIRGHIVYGEELTIGFWCFDLDF